MYLINYTKTVLTISQETSIPEMSFCIQQDDSPKGNCNGHKTESEGVPYLANGPKSWRIILGRKFFLSKKKFSAKFLLRGNKNLGEGGFFLFDLI